MSMSSPRLVMGHSSSSSNSSSSSSSSNNGGPWLVSLLSFAAGAASTSFLWYMTRQRQHQLDRSTLRIKATDVHGNENENATLEGTTSSSSPTAFLKLPSMEDIKNHIGELPSGARKRWPWDRIRRSNSHAETDATADSSSDDNENCNNDTSNNAGGGGDKNHDDTDDANNNKDKDEKSETCIGSIFGLDVGGSLAKLVYFERNEASSEAAVVAAALSSAKSPRHLDLRPEERRSRAAAAAQAVLMARRGGSTDISSSSTTITSKDGTTATAATKPASWFPQSFDDDEDEGEIDHGDYHHSIVTVEEEEVPRKGRSQSFSATIFKRHEQQQQHHRLRAGSVSAAAASNKEARKRQTVGVVKSSSLRQMNKKRHSKDSDADLRKLYDLRQESVPTNLHAYAESYPTSVAAAAKMKQQNNAKTDNAAATATTTNNNNDLSSPTAAAAAAAESDDTKQGGTEEKEMPRAKSMLNLSMNRDQKEALDRFYSFARRLDSYRDGVRDDKLSFYCRELGGDFHFVHFETRRMQHAMDLIRAHNLHKNISKMGATGGGAHRFAQDWQNQLGVAMDKQEELDSLVAGMQFTLSTVAGECYTFRPPDKMPPESAAANNVNGNGIDNNPDENSDQVNNSATSNNPNDDNGQNVMNNPVGNINNNPSKSNHKGSHQSRVASMGRKRSSGSSGSYGNYLGMDDGDDSDESSSSSPPPYVEEDDNAYVKRGRIDEWWWSHKVKRDAITVPSNNYPYLLVTIGTGVSILRVDGPRKHERISGSTIGGGTYWGLIRLLTSVERFEDVLRLAERGDPSKCDLMVGDIYGNNPDALEKLGLPSNLVASSFGKLMAKEDPAEGLKEEDLARALLLMVTNNIGQVAYLNAQLYKTSRIYFVGNFLRQNRISQRRLSFAIDYWSKGEMEALFLEHEGYFGALGAFLLSQGIDLGNKHHGFSQWKEEQTNSNATMNKQNKATPATTSSAEAATTAAARRKLVLERQRSKIIANFLHL